MPLDIPKQTVSGNLTFIFGIAAPVAIPKQTVTGTMQILELSAPVAIPKQTMTGTMEQLEVYGDILIPMQHGVIVPVPSVTLGGSVSIPKQTVTGEFDTNVRFQAPVAVPMQGLTGTVDSQTPSFIAVPMQQVSGSVFAQQFGINIPAQTIVGVLSTNQLDASFAVPMQQIYGIRPEIDAPISIPMQVIPFTRGLTLGGILTLLESAVNVANDTTISTDFARPMVSEITVRTGMLARIAGDLTVLASRIELGRPTEVVGELPALQSSITAAAGTAVVIDGTLTALASSIEASAASVATVNGILPNFASDIIVGTGLLATVDGKLPLMDARIDAVMGTGLTVASVLPLLESSIRVVPVLGLSISAQTPKIGSTIYSRVTLSVSQGRMVVAMNTVNGAVTTYDLPFVSLVTINGKCYGAGPLGIFELTGDTDNGAPIAANIRTGRLDFSDSRTKRATDAYVEASCAGGLSFQVVGDSATYPYALGAPSTNLVNRKANLGRGIKTRRWQFGVTNVAGADFELAGVSVLVDATSRRV